ncbi:7TM diverse intracellular signaling domain-containing protein [Clostridium ganghwense]|uniref:histidine kinase n=1 Tax=Clostridium ganghwense TaxID=312089 RepID=A0ABT4CK50_9CLOT|nr:7TM diverse intracellular signaling domain-containing protein [Clostridium ganghwense]MCY6369422.1 ATP-binding protein [Clostridium ganghwense]
MKNKKSKIILGIILLIVIVIVAAKIFLTEDRNVSVAQNGYIDLSKWNFEKDGILELDGEWEFYYNKLYKPEDFSSNTIKNKQYFKIPSNLNGTVIDGKKLNHYGYMTLRLIIKLNEKDADKFLGLKVQNMLTASKIWINGDLTDYHGVVAKNEKQYKPIFKPTLSIFKSKTNYVEIVIQTANFREPFSSIESLYIGTKNQILKKQNIQLAIDLFLIGSIFIIALYHLGLFKIRPQNKSTLYFGLFCLDIGMRSLFMGERILVQVFPNMHFEVISKFAAISYYVAVPLFLMFLKELFSEISDQIVSTSKYVGIVMTFICLVTTNKIYDEFAIVSQIYTVGICLYVLYNLLKLSIRREENAFQVVLGFISIIIALLCDILGYDGYMRIRVAMPIGVFLFIFIQSYMLAKKFSNAFVVVERLAEENDAMYKEIKEMNIQLEGKVRDRTKKLYNSRKELKNLLDNAGQGFLTFGRELIVDEEYSIQCKDIFNMEINNKKISEILFINNLEDKKLFIRIIDEIFNTSDEHKIQMLIELMPKVINIYNKDITIEYKVLYNTRNENDKRIMIILTDISEKKELENRIEQERNILKMVVNAVIYYEDSNELINSYIEFCQVSFDNLLKSNKKFEDVYCEILRKIHTYKGNFAQMNMLNTAYELEEIEESLVKIKDKLTIDNFKMAVDIYILNNAIKEDLNKLTTILGKDYFDKEKIVIDREKLSEIENMIQENFNEEESRKIIHMIRRLLYVPLKKLLEPYCKYTVGAAESLEKQIYTMEVEGDDISVDLDKYQDLIKSMIHIFRNMLDHGIESVEERVRKGKNEYGKIICFLKKQGNDIIIKIQDDGCGIDLHNLKKKIVQRNLLSYTEAEALSEEETLEYIFKDGFTTKDYCTQLSGRGVGLSAVRKEVEKLNGNIEVYTKVDEGTTFKIIIKE